ncbi:MAG: glutathione synthase [Granulosicoccaceae bacterium]|jgi:glutathione synthase
MPIRVGVVMDPIAHIKVAKDSSLAMLREVARRGWQLVYMELADLYLDNDQGMARMRPLQVFEDDNRWFALGEPAVAPLGELDVILMRKDPPFDTEYLYATYILEAAERAGTLVVNKPASLRDANEKLFATQFPDCIAPSRVARDADTLRAFIAEHKDVIFKPLGEMGGASIFRVREGDPNTSVIIETLTGYGSRYIMAQRFIPEISAGDKRILLIDGEPVPYALARIPAPGETRGNLAAGGKGVGVELSARDREICACVAPVLRDMGLLFVGIDVIGDYLTEINSTSPTCIRELDAQYGLNISGQLMDVIEKIIK